jgi:hypothetical protein
MIALKHEEHSDGERRCGNPKSGDQWANSLRADERRSLSKPVASPGHRLDFESARLGQPPQERDAAVDHVFADDPAVPAAVDQLVACDHLAQLVMKRDQHFQGLRLHSLGDAVDRIFVRRRIDSQPAEPKWKLDRQIDAPCLQ